jgi:hypothetical protein
MQEPLFTMANPEDFVRPMIRRVPILGMANEAVKRLHALSSRMCADQGRACIAPERLARPR